MIRLFRVLVMLLSTMPLAIAQTTTSEASPAEENGLSFVELMTKIERTHPMMGIADAGVDEIEAKQNQADWAYFPSFKLESATAAAPEVSSNRVYFDRWGALISVKLSMVQPIYTFGKIKALQRAADRGVNVVEAKRNAARWELYYRTTEAYMGRLLSDELNVILSDGNKWIEKANQRMEKLRDADSDDYDQLEHLRLKTRVAEFYSLEAENLLLANQTNNGLRLLLSLPEGNEVVLKEKTLSPIEMEPKSADVYLKIAMQQSPELIDAEMQGEAERALADAKKADLWPDILIVGELGYQHHTLGKDLDKGFNGGVALALRWNLDVPQRLFKADEASAKARRMEQQALVTKQLLELKIRKLHQQLVNKKRLVEIFAQSQKAAQGWLTATWDAYDTGFGGFKDMMDALIQFYQKKIGYLQAVFDYNMAIASLSRALGMDITTLDETPFVDGSGK